MLGLRMVSYRRNVVSRAARDFVKASRSFVKAQAISVASNGTPRLT
jgi:hypothetical protein